MRLIVATTFCLTTFSGFLAAAELPKSAKPAAVDEIKTLYSGKTTLWSKDNSAFFAVDGTVKGVYKGGYFDGKWDVTENEVCMKVQGTDSKTKSSNEKTTTDCWKWYRDAKGRLWTFWSVRYDGSKPSKKDYYTEEVKKLNDGDLVSKRYDKAKGS